MSERHGMANIDSDASSTTSSTSDNTPSSHIKNSAELANGTNLMDLFGVQLEVTSKLLDAERRKLSVLQRELGVQLNDPGVHKKDIDELQINLSRIQQQHDQLDREYREAAMGVLKKSNKLRRSSRSQPAFGLKQTPKSRPSIFGTLAKEKPPENNRKSLGPQMSNLAHMFEMAGDGYRDVVKQLDENDIVHNCNDWNYPSAHQLSQALIYQDGNLISGSLEALIQHLVPTSRYYPDRTYIFAFLLSSRLYVRPHTLLGEVCKVCIYQQNLMNEKINKESLGKFGPYLLQLLSEWTEMFPYDFRDERMMKHLKDMTQRLVNIYPELRRDVGLLMHNLFSRLSGLQKYEELLQRINAEVAQRLLNVMPTTDIYEVCSSPLVLAQQLTHIELERLSMIGPEEFVQAFAKESDETTFKDLKQTNNLEAYVQWFNRLSYFVATEVCMHLKKKNRVKMIEFFVDVAKECINIGNFNSLMAIIAGVNMSPIQRLKKTWAKVNTDKFDILEHQMNPSNNFGSYRSSLKAALWRSQGAVDDRERIVIPFFSLFVKDIYFLNEGCSNRLSNGHMNFEKFWHLAKQITEFITWKQVECPFDRCPTVLNYVLTNPVFSENSLALASFECEPPENNYEKERHKQLKAQAGL